ncbi:hypothetical protein CYY_008229 [Polysphondylium violaceum]|uniref:Uncharacterized protein n=1 Tax=Polysphondylium violaceum TaxID=133409 RepID=A0A8J4PNF0_9MYCE|nr:hypothetical protein CYY_008229 [Polysphondylium violaceum]
MNSTEQQTQQVDDHHPLSNDSSSGNNEHKDDNKEQVININSADEQQQQSNNSSSADIITEEDGDSYIIQGFRKLIIIDSDDSTNRAVNKAMENFDKEKDELYLLTVTSSLDYLNDEKNDAKLTMYKYEHYFDSIGITYTPISVEAFDILNKIRAELDENEIDIVYVGETALTSVSNPDNILFSVFSSIKKALLGTIVSGIKRESERDNCPWKLFVC